MEKKHIVDAETGKLCLTCRRVTSLGGQNYCGRFVTAHDGLPADLALVRYLRGDSCHTAWDAGTAPIIATAQGWLDLGTGKIVDVPDRPVAGETPAAVEGFSLGLSAGGTVKSAENPAWRFVIPEDAGKDIPDRVLNPACWPENAGKDAQ